MTNGLTHAPAALLPRLARCFVAQDRATAQRLALQYPDFYFLLPDGICYNGHAVSGGRKTGSGPLALKRELREVSGQVEEKQKKLDQTARLLEDLEREMAPVHRGHGTAARPATGTGEKDHRRPGARDAQAERGDQPVELAAGGGAGRNCSGWIANGSARRSRPNAIAGWWKRRNRPGSSLRRRWPTRRKSSKICRWKRPGSLKSILRFASNWPAWKSGGGPNSPASSALSTSFAKC